jgi:LAO/AO transport system kinase
LSLPNDPAELLEAARGGDRGALARLLSLVERGAAEAREVGRLAHPLAGSAYSVGLTGAPGAGKSTLTGRLVGALRATGDRVAVVAVDPTSPFTGGAILGDRVRMDEHTLDEGVFIRSMATRGQLGGLAVAAPQALRVLDAAGFPWLVVETVGVGQVEVDVAGATDTVVVVVNPGWGDGVQAAKAGLLEIADVFVVNKADRPGADDAERDLRHLLDLATRRSGAWRPPIVRTVATTGEGTDELLAAVREHRSECERSGLLEERRTARAAEELRAVLVARMLDRVHRLEEGEAYATARAAVTSGRQDPWTATDALMEDTP